VSIWHVPPQASEDIAQRPRIPAHPLTLSDLAIFGGGMLLAVLLGIAATGLIPI
jgi:hypothetical protein